MVEDNERTLALMNSTGYEIQQDNGQRIYGPPPDWDGPAPKETEVFIGKLPNDVYEYDLVPLFESCGKIYMLRIMQNFSGLNRGFAFVQYTTPEEADKAIRFLNNVEIRKNERIGVVKSRNNCRLYIGKLDQTMTREEIRKELDILTEDIVDVIIHKNDVEGLNNRGYAFVEYQTHKAAAKARRKLVPCKIKIRGHEIQVDWATPCHESGDSLSIQTSLLIKNLRESCRNDELVYYYSLRNKFKIIKFKRLPTQALISFNSKQEAEFAMRIYNEIKDSAEFNYFAEKDKRVEIVWLKNTMDLSLFSSSVNYPLPRIFSAPQCCQPNHQQRSTFHSGGESIGPQTNGHRQSAFVPFGQANSSGNRSPNDGVNGKAASNCSNCCGHPNNSPNGYPNSSPNGYPNSSPNGYPANSPNGHLNGSSAYPNGNSSINPNGSPTYPNGILNGISNGSYSARGGQRFQAQIIEQNGMRPRFGQHSPPTLTDGNFSNGARNGSIDSNMFSNRPLNANRQHAPPTSLNLQMPPANECNPFTAIRRTQTNRAAARSAAPFTGEEAFNGYAASVPVWNGGRHQSNGQSSVVYSKKNASDKLNDKLNATMNTSLNTTLNTALNDKLNTSYSVWQSDAPSTNWGTERKIVRRSTFASFENNISEEDTCSLKSDSSSCSPDNFNCFNPCLNLADNLRTLTTTTGTVGDAYQRIPPVYPVYPTTTYSNYPVLQQ